MLPKEFYYFEELHWFWITLKHNPYIPLFEEKILQAEETGLNHKFWDEPVLFKIKEEVPIKPLKLEHFYITLIGNVIGLVLSLTAFAYEMLVVPKNPKPRNKQ